jgi:hypothetical protein
MPWQDFMFTIGSIIFAIALLPSIFSPHKPALTSSIMTGSVLYMFSMTYFTLDLTFSALSTLMTAGMWSTLAVQKCRQMRTREPESIYA